MEDGSSLISVHGRQGTRSPSWRHQHQAGVGDTGGKWLEGNGHRDGGLHHSSTCSKTSTGFSEQHIANEAGNLHRCFLTSLGAYRNQPIWHGLHDHQSISWNSVEFRPLLRVILEIDVICSKAGTNICFHFFFEQRQGRLSSPAPSCDHSMTFGDN